MSDGNYPAELDAVKKRMRFWLAARQVVSTPPEQHLSNPRRLGDVANDLLGVPLNWPRSRTIPRRLRNVRSRGDEICGIRTRWMRADVTGSTTDFAHLREAAVVIR